MQGWQKAINTILVRRPQLHKTIPYNERERKGKLRGTWSGTAYIILPQIDDVQGHTPTHPQLENWHHGLHGPVVKGVYRQLSTTLQNSTPKLANNTPKGSPKKQSIMEYLQGLPQDTKPLRSCSGNRAKMFLKSHLGIKCHSQYNKIIRFLQHSSANSWCIVCDLEIIIVVFLLAFNFIHQRSHHSLTFTRSRLRDC